MSEERDLEKEHNDGGDESLEDTAHDPGRRKTLASLAVTLGAGAVGTVAVPAAISAHAPVAMDTVRSSGDFAPVGKLTSFREGIPRQVEITARKQDAWSNLGEVTVGRAWVIKKPGNEFAVFSAICPHLGCGVDWQQDKEQFSCPCHVSHFGREGDAGEGPSKRGLDPLEYQVDGDMLLVRFQRFELNIADRKPVEA